MHIHEDTLGFTTGESMWDRIEQFCMVIDHDCPGQDLVGFYKNPNDPMIGTWYFPSDEVTEVTIFTPPPVVKEAA